jgi:NADPH:quinone reductase-like Zn-dependent oxidoreductase
MRAIGYNASRSNSEPRSLRNISLPDPEPGPHDLLVRVDAVSVIRWTPKCRVANHPAANHGGCWAGMRPAP